MQTGVFSAESPLQLMEIVLNNGQDFSDKLFIRKNAVANNNGNDRADLIKFENDATIFYTITPDNIRLVVEARK